MWECPFLRIPKAGHNLHRMLMRPQLAEHKLTAYASLSARAAAFPSGRSAGSRSERAASSSSTLTYSKPLAMCWELALENCSSESRNAEGAPPDVGHVALA